MAQSSAIDLGLAPFYWLTWCGHYYYGTYIHYTNEYTLSIRSQITTHMRRHITTAHKLQLACTVQLYLAKNWNQGKHFGGWDLGYPSMIQEHVNVVTVEGPGKGKYVCYTAMQLHRFGMTLHVLCMSCLPTALSWRRKLWAQAHQLDAIATIVTVILCPRLLSLHCLIHTVVYNLCILWILSISHI